MPSIFSGNVTQRERQIAVGIQARHYAQGICRQASLVHILASDMEDPVLGGCYVDPSITQCVKIPLGARVIVG